MNEYVEIRIRRNPEVSLGFLWRRVYQKLHEAFALAKRKGKTFGVSFPEYGDSGFPLGTKLRVFGEKGTLESLGLKSVFESMSDFVKVSGTREVPEKHEWVVFKSANAKRLSPAKIRRYARRHGISYEEAEKVAKRKLGRAKGKERKYPYFVHESLSGGGRRASIFVKMEKAEGKGPGIFNGFGLSGSGETKSAVPWF